MSANRSMSVASGYAYGANNEPVNVVELLKSLSSKGAVVYTDRYIGSKTHVMPTECTGLNIINDSQSEIHVKIILEENAYGLSEMKFDLLLGEMKSSTYLPFRTVEVTTDADASYRIEGAL